MKKNHTITLLILSIIVTISVTCLFFFFLRVIKNKNINTSANVATLEEKMQEKKDATIFSEKFTEIQLIRNSIDSHFIDPNNVDKFVDYLEKMGQSVGSEVLIKNIEVVPKTKNIISFKLSINGTFQDVSETIALLENIPYQVDITSVYMNIVTEQPVQGDINKVKAPYIPSWQADVSFNILSKE